MTDQINPDNTTQLFKKLVATGEALQSIEKTGTNKGLGFKFVEASHAYDRVRSELYKRGVFMATSLGAVRQEGVLTHVEMTATFVDAESGATLSVPWHGYGSDKQDKGMAKAVTAGVKSLLLTFFLIPSGVEPDADSPTDQTSKSDGLSTERLMEIVLLAKDCGVSDAKVKTKINALGAKRASDLTEEQAKKLSDWITKQRPAMEQLDNDETV
jgi:hypothetical protein